MLQRKIQMEFPSEIIESFILRMGTEPVTEELYLLQIKYSF